MRQKIWSLLVWMLGIAGGLDAQVIPSLENMSDGIHHWNLGHPVRHYGANGNVVGKPYRLG